MLSNLLKLRTKIPKLVEPDWPQVKSRIPGPESISLLNQYAAVSQDHLNVKLFTDYEHSIGNYLCDADGNLVLDLSGQDGSLAVGYNHAKMLEFSKSPSVKLDLLQRSACAIMPSSNWISQVSQVLMPLAPAGLTDVFNSCGCSSSTNENAIKTASLWFYKQKYGEKYSQEQLASALQGKFPGIPNFALLKFTGSFHGNYLGGNSASDSPNDYPKLHWPSAHFPKSEQEEAKSLDQIEKIFKTHKDPIMAVIVEPIQKIGNYFASKGFYASLQKIVRQNQAALIVDESFCGFGGTGTLWAHEHFGIEPDILTYGGKSQASGFFMKKEFRPPQAAQVISTWCGDPLRVELLKGIRSIVQSENLIENAKSTGEYLIENLGSVLETKNRGKKLRGIGLHVAFDLENKEKAWQVALKMLQKGVHVNVTNQNVIQIHPALVFKRKHADIFLQVLSDSL